MTPMVNACVIAVNDYLPTRISMIKEKEILKTETDKDGMTHTTLTRVPGEGFIFGLYNSDPIAYKDGLLDADVLLATAISDKNGQISFSGHFPHGNYYVRELAGPEGWKLNETDYGAARPEHGGALFRYALRHPRRTHLCQRHAGGSDLQRNAARGVQD